MVLNAEFVIPGQCTARKSGGEAEGPGGCPGARPHGADTCRDAAGDSGACRMKNSGTCRRRRGLKVKWAKKHAVDTTMLNLLFKPFGA
eukprot:2645645-Rhodomonas_salina.1